MSFIIRQPLSVSSALRFLPQASTKTIRTFHSSPLSKSRPQQQYVLRFTSPLKSKILSKPSVNSGKRFYQSPPTQRVLPTQTGSLLSRLLYGGAIFAGGAVAANMVFNRETREDGGMPLFERSYLNETFMHTGLGVGIIGLGARALHTSGWSIRLMSMNPWLVVGGGLALSIGSMIATRSIDPDHYLPKYTAWTAFNLSQSLILSPLLFLQPALLARAGLYTVAMMGSIAFVGATAKQEKYLYLGGPLLAGCALVAVSGFAPLVLQEDQHNL